MCRTFLRHRGSDAAAPLPVLRLLLIILSLAAAAPVRAQSSVDASAILSQSDVSQMAAWLGEGDIGLTRIFEKTVGSTPFDFHAAADGQGRTFSVMEVFFNPVAGGPQVREVIGGYNPQSWNSSDTYNFSPANAERTAFIFNLTDAVKQAQKADAGGNNHGLHQTLNFGGYGPSFGGIDIEVSGNLTTGYAAGVSYGTVGDPFGYGYSILGPNFSIGNPNIFTVGALEVFTIGAASPAAVPEFGTVASLGALLGLAGVGAVRSRRRHRGS